MKFRWSKLLRFTAIAALIAVLAGCSNNKQNQIESAAITPAEVELGIGDSKQLELTLTLKSGKTVAADSVEWESGDSAIADVSADGLVTGVSAGITSITGIHAETHKDSINVTVLEESDTGDDDDNGEDDDNDEDPEPGEGSLFVTFNGDDVTGSTVQLARTQIIELTAELEDAEDAEYSWAVEGDSGKVKLTSTDAVANVKAVKTGDATITVTSGEQSASVTVSITAMELDVQIDAGDAGIGSTGEATATLTGLFTDADDTIKWSAYPENRISLDQEETTSGDSISFEIESAGDVTVIATSLQDSAVSKSVTFTALDPKQLDTSNVYVGSWGSVDTDWVKGSIYNPFEDFSDIDGSGDTALDVVTEDGMIHVADGTYKPSNQLTVNTAGVTIRGESESATIIDQSNLTSNGIRIRVDNITVESLTVHGSEAYAFKVGTGGDLEGFTMEDVTVYGDGKTRIDLNGVSNVHLVNVTAEGATDGVGISMTAADGVTLDGVHTRNNAWGGVGIYIDNQDKDVSNVLITSSSTFDEDVPIYAETENQSPNGDAKFSNFNFEGFDYAVYNPGEMKDSGNNGEKFDYYFRNLDDAAEYARYLENEKNVRSTDRSTIQATNPNDTSKRANEWFVEKYMDIRTAVERSRAQDTVYIADGTYVTDEQLDFPHSLTLEGQSEAGTVIDQSGIPQSSISNTYPDGFRTRVSGVTLRSMTIQGGKGYAVKVDTGTQISDFVMEDVTVYGNGQSRIDFNNVNTVSLTNVTAEGATNGVGISMTAADGVTLDGVRTKNNAWGGVGIYIDDQDKDVNNVHITSSSTFDEDVPVYAETENQSPNGDAKFSNFNFEGFDYAVYNPGDMKNNNRGVKFDYYFRNLDDAAEYARYLENEKNVDPEDRSTIQATNPNDTSKRANEWFVEEDLSIQTAIDRADENHTVNVGSGTYTLSGHIEIATSGLHIIGNESSKPVLTGGGFHIRGPSVSLEGFYLEDIDPASNDPAAVYLTGEVHDVTVHNNIISGTGTERGILFAAHADTDAGGPVSIFENDFRELNSGIYTNGGIHFEISTNTFTSNNAGIGNENASGIIRANTFVDNNHEGIGLSNYGDDPNIQIVDNDFVSGTVFVTRYSPSNADLSEIRNNNTFPSGTIVQNNSIRLDSSN